MKHINLALPEELLINLDEAAKELFMSRSEYIRLVLQKAVVENYEKQMKRRDKNLPQGLENDPRIFDLDDS